MKKYIIATFIVVIIFSATLMGTAIINSDNSDGAPFAEGDILSIDNFGGSAADQFQKVIGTSDGGFIAVGNSAAASFGNGDWIGITGKGNVDATIVKFDSDNNIEWKKYFGGSAADRFYGVTEMPDGGFIAVGNSAAASFGNGDWIGINGKGNNDAIIVKLDALGNIEWKEHFGGSAADLFSDVVATSNGFIAVGNSAAASFGNGDWIGINGKGNNDAIIVKYIENENGGYELNWKKHFGASYADQYNAITLTSNGDIIAVGSTAVRNDGDWAGSTGGSGQEAFIVAYNENGEIKWKASYGGALEDQFRGVTPAPDGGFIAVGYSGTPFAIPGDTSGIIVKYINDENDGYEIDWHSSFRGSYNDYFYGVTATSDGGYLAVGYNEDPEYITPYESTLVKFDASGGYKWDKEFGGLGNDQFTGVATISDYNIVIVGYSAAASFNNGNWNNILNKGGDDATIVIIEGPASTIQSVKISGEVTLLNETKVNYRDCLVVLRDAISGDILMETVPDIDVGYSFENIVPGTYYLHLIGPTVPVFRVVEITNSDIVCDLNANANASSLTGSTTRFDIIAGIIPGTNTDYSSVFGVTLYPEQKVIHLNVGTRALVKNLLGSEPIDLMIPGEIEVKGNNYGGTDYSYLDGTYSVYSFNVGTILESVPHDEIAIINSITMQYGITKLTRSAGSGGETGGQAAISHRLPAPLILNLPSSVLEIGQYVFGNDISIVAPVVIVNFDDGSPFHVDGVYIMKGNTQITRIPAAIDDIIPHETELSIEIGEKVTLRYDLDPIGDINYPFKTEVIWSPLNDSLISIDNVKSINGISNPPSSGSADITGKVVGTTTIKIQYAWDPTKYAEILVNVTEKVGGSEHIVTFDTDKGNISALLDGSEIVSGSTISGTDMVTLRYLPSVNYEFVSWTLTSGSDTWEVNDYTLIVSGLSNDLDISVNYRYFILSDYPSQIVDTGAPSPDDDLELYWTFGSGILNPGGMVWEGGTSVPLIVGDYVYVKVTDKIFKIDISTGKYTATAQSINQGSFYSYLGYSHGLIFDDRTGKVFDLDLNYIRNMETVAVYSDDEFTYILSDYGSINDGSPKMLTKYTADLSTTLWSVNLRNNDDNIYRQDPIFIDGYMYWFSYEIKYNQSGGISGSKENGGRYLNSIDVATGTDRHRVEFTEMRGCLLGNHAWLTTDGTNIYLSGYTNGLFDDDTGSMDRPKCGYVRVDKGVFSEPKYVIYGATGGQVSPFIVYDDRAFVLSNGYVHVYDKTANGFELRYTVQALAGHGGMVLDTASSKMDGTVYLYILPYASSSSLCILSDKPGQQQGIVTLYPYDMIQPEYGSQSVRMSENGVLIWYNDTGLLFAVGPASAKPDIGYTFLIQDSTDSNKAEYVTLTGTSPDDALLKYNGATIVNGDVYIDGKLYRAYYYNDFSMTDAIWIRTNNGDVQTIDSGEYNRCQNWLLMDNTALFSTSNQVFYYTSGGVTEGYKAAELPSSGVPGGSVLSRTAPAVSVTGVTLSDNTKSMDKNTVFKLTATVSPTTADSRIVWSSDNNGVATVDQNGNVTAKGVGTAVIRATSSADPTKYDECTVTVTGTVYQVLPERIDLDRYVLDMTGGSYQLVATVLPSSASNKNVIWESSNDQVISVDQNGNVTVLSDGTAVITVRSVINPFVYAECEVNVISNPVTSVQIDKQSIDLVVGEDDTIIVTVLPANADNKDVRWTSNNEFVATVTQDGKVIAVGEGTATITVMSESDPSKKADCTVNVSSSRAVTSISLNKSTLSLTVGGTSNLIATVLPTNATNKNVDWSSSDSSVAIVDTNGNVVAVSTGTAVIFAITTDGNKTATCIVTVTESGGQPNPVDAIRIDQSSLTMIPGNTATLTATPDSGDMTGKTIRWISGNTSVASVDSSGNIVAVAGGTAVITASLIASNGDVLSSAVCVVTVTAENNGGNNNGQNGEPPVRTEVVNGMNGQMSETTVKASVSGNNARVSKENVEAIIEQISGARQSSGNNSLPATAIVDIGSARSLGIPSPSTIANAGAGLRIVSDNGTIEISNSVLRSITSGKTGDLTINVNVVDRNELMKDHRDRLGSNDVVFEVNAYMGSSAVHQLGGNVTVSLPYTIPAGVSIDDLHLWYLNDNGTIEELSFTYKNGCIVFSTNHFSYFAVGSADVSGSGGLDSNTVLILMAVAIIALAVCLAFMIGRSSKAKSERN